MQSPLQPACQRVPLRRDRQPASWLKAWMRDPAHVPALKKNAATGLVHDLGDPLMRFTLPGGDTIGRQ